MGVTCRDDVYSVTGSELIQQWSLSANLVLLLDILAQSLTIYAISLAELLSTVTRWFNLSTNQPKSIVCSELLCVGILKESFSQNITITIESQ